MRHLFTAHGQTALAALLRQNPLLAFDFDGTLAPIVSRPSLARIPKGVAARLTLLAARLPVAIITGRAIEDVRRRLGFEPQFIVGNHGAEDTQEPSMTGFLAQVLNAVRFRLAARQADLGAAGVQVEDKGQSIALHYRRAPQTQRAVGLIHEILLPKDELLHVFSGKMVINIVAAKAPNKADALLGLLSRCASDHAFFVGDDVNDEPVFAAAPETWLTVRIGQEDAASQAMFFLRDPAEIPHLLDQMLQLLGTLPAKAVALRGGLDAPA